MLITAAEIISQSAELYQKNYQSILRYLILLFIPAGIFAAAGVIIGSFAGVMAAFGFGVPLLVYLIMAIITSLASLWLSLSLIRHLSALHQGQTAPNLKENLQTGLHLVWPALLVSILTSLIILGGIVLLIVPGIIFAIWFAFSFYAVVIDGKKTAAALSESKNLARGRWWGVLWRLLAPSVVFGVILILIQWLVGIPIEIILKNFQKGTILYAILLTVFTLLSVIISLLFTPLSSLATIILYQELKKTPAEEKNKKPEPPQI